MRKTSFISTPKVKSEMKLGAIDNDGKNDALSANKQSNKLHTAVSVAFSYFHQCRVKNGGKTLLFIVFSADSTDGGGAKG